MDILRHLLLIVIILLCCVADLIHSDTSELSVTVKAIAILTFHFERVPERLNALSMGALDAVSKL